MRDKKVILDQFCLPEHEQKVITLSNTNVHWVMWRARKFLEVAIDVRDILAEIRDVMKQNLAFKATNDSDF